MGKVFSRRGRGREQEVKERRGVKHILTLEIGGGIFGDLVAYPVNPFSRVH